MQCTHLVLLGVLYDGLGPGGEPQRRLGLLALRGGHRADDRRPGVPAEGVLQDAGQLRIWELKTEKTFEMNHATKDMHNI